MHVLLGVTGSVAAIKTRALLEALIEKLEIFPNVIIRVIVSRSGCEFLQENDLDKADQVYYDDCEWTGARKWKKGDPVLHIELRKWADILVIAPLSANTLAKVACGLCDTLLTCVVRAWDIESTPLLLCPAMNTLMWNHPLTFNHIQTCTEILKAKVMQPISKTLACGDHGLGALPEPCDIAKTVRELLLSSYKSTQ